MLYSKLFGKTSKTQPADDSVNARLLTQAGYISKQMAGIYNYLPLGLRTLNKIQNIVREEMNAVNGNEILMPALTLLENYIKTGRDQSMNDIFYYTEGEGGSKLVLNPTHEEIVTPLVQKYTFSYRDLPLVAYQFQNKYRNEPRAKSGLLRGREFNMKDMYSFHTTEADLDTYYEKARSAYHKVYERLGLGDITLFTYASGGVFSKYSHEFQTLSEVGEDTIYVCEKCHLAVNKELYDEQNKCPTCGNTELAEKKSIEVGNIFKLRTKYSKPLNFVYHDENDQEKLVEMGCYGIGISRLMGALVEIFHDDKGIIWPENVAPFKVHLTHLGKEAETKEMAEKTYRDLTAKGVEVLFDDRDGISAGAKLGDADLIGIPYRVVISKKTLAENSVELKKRNETEAKLVKIDKLTF